MPNHFRPCVIAFFLLLAAPETYAQATILGANDAGISPACAPAPGKVDEKGFVTLGGIEQWITVKGDSCTNPVILFISGGPGNPLSVYSDAVYGAWAKDFTLVQWDQRGAGKTYGRSPPAADATLTIAQMRDDGNELAAYVAHRYGKKKVILWGSSWGSVLAVHMAKAQPELFYAYLGTSQLVNMRENETVSYNHLLELVRAAQDSVSLAVLEGVGPPPWLDPRSFGKVRRVIRAYEAKVTTPAPAAWWTPAAEYATPQAQADYEAGEDYSFINFVGRHDDGMASTIDLPALGTDFAIPVFLVEGKHDLLALPEVAQRYFDSIKAPQKHLVVLDHAGHDPNQQVVDAEYKILIERIRPLAH